MLLAVFLALAAYLLWRLATTLVAEDQRRAAQEGTFADAPLAGYEGWEEAARRGQLIEYHWAAVSAFGKEARAPAVLIEQGGEAADYVVTLMAESLRRRLPVQGLGLPLYINFARYHGPRPETHRVCRSFCKGFSTLHFGLEATQTECPFCGDKADLVVPTELEFREWQDVRTRWFGYRELFPMVASQQEAMARAEIERMKAWDEKAIRRAQRLS